MIFNLGIGDFLKTIITYGTFDLFHSGHLNLFRRLKDLGDYLIVAVSSDEFNIKKGKSNIVPFSQRSEIVSAIRYVDLVIKEDSWDQKVDDIKLYNVDIFGIGSDWEGKFDYLNHLCEVIYLPRTAGISSTILKSGSLLQDNSLNSLKQAQSIIETIIKGYSV
jgi:glycerol-3-phosphate cytidylyltransferase